MATTDYVLRYSSRYIACSDCKTKATRGPSLMYPKCGNVNYLAKISVYDNNDQSLPFLVMQDVSRLVTIATLRRCLSPKALINTIGQTHKFSVMVSEYSLTGNTQTTIATKAAATTCYVAASTRLRNVCGKYFSDCNEAQTSKSGSCNLKAQRLWTASEFLVTPASTPNVRSSLATSEVALQRPNSV
ncbi:hypothetical protein F2Q69_00036311 [Brassica cretica]|uniref:Replication factor A C-terminal domain-containing protein n=1 Tax=Brassica cretica TaxID=69181 RepID=A0A8S9SHR0_BRACR|nr:hypothetical protein F2Q69_00036311 [Brassica cretica]